MRRPRPLKLQFWAEYSTVASGISCRIGAYAPRRRSIRAAGLLRCVGVQPFLIQIMELAKILYLQTVERSWAWD
jgi:hypothetical protein